jgi:hypothetical protein
MRNRLLPVAAFSLLVPQLLLTMSCAHHRPALKLGDALIDQTLTMQQKETRELRLSSGGPKYTVVAHSNRVQPHIKGNYNGTDLKELEKAIAPALVIAVSPQGFVQAADRDLGGKKDDTNYDAVWLRDTMWVYLGLQSVASTHTEKVLQRMFDYLGSEPQLERMDRVIQKPALAVGTKGNMEAIHIRFNSRSEKFDDVMVNDKPEPWNHKQNDALGLFYDLALRALEAGELEPSELKANHWRMLTGLPCYFDRIRFHEMEDAGPWEEIDRVNTSSIGLVTSSLENLERILRSRQALAWELQAASRKNGNERCMDVDFLKVQVDRGYGRIQKQLKAGGESPIYPRSSPKYREADAALLNLIYPARLSRLTIEDKQAILRFVQPLIGRVGVKRYLYDPYQSGNYWLPGVQSEGSQTADASSIEAFAVREAKFIPGTEAQWFFDSWMSVVYGRMFKETKEPAYRERQIYHFNRALGQITGKLQSARQKRFERLRAEPHHAAQLGEGEPAAGAGRDERSTREAKGQVERRMGGSGSGRAI